MKNCTLDLFDDLSENPRAIFFLKIGRRTYLVRWRSNFEQKIRKFLRAALEKNSRQTNGQKDGSTNGEHSSLLEQLQLTVKVGYYTVSCHFNPGFLIACYHTSEYKYLYQDKTAVSAVLEYCSWCSLTRIN